jgi:hypothetical protein
MPSWTERADRRRQSPDIDSFLLFGVPIRCDASKGTGWPEDSVPASRGINSFTVRAMNAAIGVGKPLLAGALDQQDRRTNDLAEAGARGTPAMSRSRMYSR